MINPNYKPGKSIWKGIKQVLIFGIPLIVAIAIQWDPTIMSITVGGLFNIVLNWAKHN